MRYEFVNPKNSAKYDDLNAFRSFYTDDLLPRCLEIEKAGGNFRVGFKTELSEIKQAAYKEGAMKIVLAIQTMVDSLSEGVQLLSLTNGINEVQESFDDIMSGDLGAMLELYPILEKAYKGKKGEMLKLLEAMAVENNGLSLIYLINARENLDDLSKQEIIEYEKDFANPTFIAISYEILLKAYEKNKVGDSSLDKAFLKDILSNMNPIGSSFGVDQEFLGNNIKNAKTLIKKLGWHKDLPLSVLEGRTIGTKESLKNYEDMGQVLKMVVNGGNAHAFYTLMSFPSFEDVFNSQKEFFMEAMYKSSDPMMVIATLELADSLPREDQIENVVNVISEMEADDVEIILDSIIEQNNYPAMNLVTETLCRQGANTEIVKSLMKYSLEKAIIEDNPGMLGIILDSRILDKSDVESLDAYQMFGKCEETKNLKNYNLSKQIPKMICNALNDGDIDMFDNLMSILGPDNINLTITEDGSTPLMLTLEAGHSVLARHILDNYYVLDSTQREALFLSKVNGEAMLDLLNPNLDGDIIDTILTFDKVNTALDTKVDNPFGKGCDGLTPLLSIVRKHGVDGAEIINKYADAGANIWDVDNLGYDMFAWVKSHAEGKDSSPLYNLYQRMEKELKEIEEKEQEEMDHSKLIELAKEKLSLSDGEDSALGDSDFDHSESGSLPHTPRKGSFNSDDGLQIDSGKIVISHPPLCRMDAMDLGGEAGDLYPENPIEVY